MHHHTFDGLSFVDALGIYRVIYGCPLKQRKELAHTLQTLNERLQISQLKTIKSAYDHDPEFQAIADHALRLCRIEPDWISAEMLTELLFAHRDADGQPQRALLEQLNFPVIDKANEVESTTAEAIAALWSHTQDLEQALKLAGHEPGAVDWAELGQILEARNAQTPEGKEKAEIERAIQDLQKVSDGALVPESLAVATPDQTEQLLRMI